MLKRLRFVFTSALLSVILGFFALGPHEFRFYYPIFFGFLTIPAVYLALGRLRGIENITFSVPAFFLSLGFAYSFFYFPNFANLYKIVFLFGLFSAFYLYFLAVNIFKVSRTLGRKIPLVKSAYPTFFLLMFLITFLNFTAVYKTSLPLAGQLGAIFGYMFLMGLSFLWSLSLSDLFERELLLFSLLVAFATLEIAISFSFAFFAEAYLRALTISAFSYGFLGLARANFEKSLTFRHFLEYGLLISAVIFLSYYL